MKTKHCPEFDATEITLSNGMRVCYKCTDFLDDEVFPSTFECVFLVSSKVGRTPRTNSRLTAVTICYSV